MREIADPDCYFVHIGGNATLEHELSFYDQKIFQPTNVELHKQECKVYGDTQIVISDVDYGLLLDGKSTTHHFMTTEVYYQNHLVQFTFTALVY